MRYSGRAKEIYLSIIGDTANSEVCQLYYNEAKDVYWYRKSTGYLHILKIEDTIKNKGAWVDCRPVYYIVDYLLKADGTFEKYRVRSTALDRASAEAKLKDAIGVNYRFESKGKIPKSDRSTKVILTNMCMIYDDKYNVLVQDRTGRDWQGIVFPGGHIESNESITDSVIREVYEETGFKIFHPQLCGVRNWIREDGVRYIVLLFRTNEFVVDPRAIPEFKPRWVSLIGFGKINGLAPGMKSLVDVFRCDTMFEQYYSNENGNWVEILK